MGELLLPSRYQVIGPGPQELGPAGRSPDMCLSVLRGGGEVSGSRAALNQFMKYKVLAQRESLSNNKRCTKNMTNLEKSKRYLINRYFSAVYLVLV